MSIRDVINEHIRSGSLMVWEHAIPSRTCSRCILVGKQMYEGFRDDYWSDPDCYNRLMALRADLDFFIEGGELAIGWHPFNKADSAFMARTHHIERNVWDIRSRDPKPAIRVFGVFAEKDTFVALDWEFRSSLPTPRDWLNANENTLVRWSDLFPSHSPYSGDNLHDFFSNSATIV